MRDKSKRLLQDGKVSAACETTELDELLGRKAVQRRELQGDESEEFTSHFHAQGGIR